MYNEQYESAKYPVDYDTWDPQIRSDGNHKINQSALHHLNHSNILCKC